MVNAYAVKIVFPNPGSWSTPNSSKIKVENKWKNKYEIDVFEILVTKK